MVQHDDERGYDRRWGLDAGGDGKSAGRGGRSVDDCLKERWQWGGGGPHGAGLKGRNRVIFIEYKYLLRKREGKILDDDNGK